jgi:hypothetical protein
LKGKSSSRKPTKLDIQKEIAFFESLPQKREELIKQDAEIRDFLTKHGDLSDIRRQVAEKVLEANKKAREVFAEVYLHYLENKANYKEMLECFEMLEKAEVELAETEREIEDELPKVIEKANKELKLFRKVTKFTRLEE